MIGMLLSFIRATRTTNWSLHLSSVRRMLPWFFAYDRINYARYLTVYWLEMMSLERTHPGNPRSANTVHCEHFYCKYVHKLWSVPASVAQNVHVK